MSKKKVVENNLPDDIGSGVGAPDEPHPNDKNSDQDNAGTKLSFQECVVVERDELTEKFEKFSEFIGGETFNGLPEDDKTLLNRQQQIMSDYIGVLNARISQF